MAARRPIDIVAAAISFMDNGDDGSRGSGGRVVQHGMAVAEEERCAGTGAGEEMSEKEGRRSECGGEDEEMQGVVAGEEENHGGGAGEVGEKEDEVHRSEEETEGAITTEEQDLLDYIEGEENHRGEEEEERHRRYREEEEEDYRRYREEEEEHHRRYREEEEEGYGSEEEGYGSEEEDDGWTFHSDKVRAARQDRWLMVNLQTVGGQNRDLWAQEAVGEVVRESFVFSQMKGDGEAASKVCYFYQLEDDDLPAVLVLDPITGQMLAKWCGAMQPEDFLINARAYTETKPSAVYKPNFPGAPPASPSSDQSYGSEEEQTVADSDSSAPMDVQEPEPVAETTEVEALAAMALDEVDDGQPLEGEEVYKIKVRFPDGNVLTREFGSGRRVASLFAYCRSVLHERAEAKQAFRITMFAGSSFEDICEGDASFDDLGMNRVTVAVVLVA